MRVPAVKALRSADSAGRTIPDALEENGFSEALPTERKSDDGRS